MFTPPRDQDDTDDEETDTKDDNTPRANELMDSFEQIKLEEETKELIEGYKKELGPEDIERLDELENIYGAKNPARLDSGKVSGTSTASTTTTASQHHTSRKPRWELSD